MPEITVRHHHHLPDGSVVVHDHAEHLGTTHVMVVAYRNPEGGWHARSSTDGKAVAECRQRCVYRRYDDE